MLYFNNHGHLSKITAPEIPGNDPSPVGDIAKPEQVDLGILTNLNNDPTRFRTMANSSRLSDQSPAQRPGQRNRPSGRSRCRGRSADAAPKPSRPTRLPMAWSPDEKMIVFTGDRDNVWEIYSAASDGSTQEKRLTNGPGRSDGPEFSRMASGFILIRTAPSRYRSGG